MKKIYIFGLALFMLTACGDGNQAAPGGPGANGNPGPRINTDDTDRRFIEEARLFRQANSALVDCLCLGLYGDVTSFQTESRCEGRPLRQSDTHQVQLKIVVRSRADNLLQDSHVFYFDADSRSDGWQPIDNDETGYQTERLERWALVVSQTSETLYRQSDLLRCEKHLR